jgi:hypothetical protein
MTIAGDPEPAPPPREDPPQRETVATEPFWDFKASHFVTAGLTFALFVVAAFQLCTYRRQADIMDKQAAISNDQLAFQESVSRAWIRANVALDGPVIFTEWAKDKFINLQLSFDVKNFGQVPAVNIRILTAIDRADGTDREQRLKKLQESMCKSARDVADSDQVGGNVAFPSEPITIKSGSGTGGLYRDGNPGALAVVGCIDYTFANSMHGQTGFRKILGRVEGKIVVGIPFVSGQPDTNAPPIPQDLLAKGYPSDPAKYARVPTDGLYFEDFEGGNYAK